MSKEANHVFLSYSRADNRSSGSLPGPIGRFVARLTEEYKTPTGNPLRVFFDVQDIEDMDPSRHKTLHELERSYVLLACLSPSYLESECCRRGFTEYLKGEISHGLSGTGIAPVYAFDIPNWYERNYQSERLSGCVCFAPVSIWTCVPNFRPVSRFSITRQDRRPFMI